MIQNSTEATEISTKKRNDIDTIRNGEIKLYPKDASQPSEIIPAPQGDPNNNTDERESLPDSSSVDIPDSREGIEPSSEIQAIEQKEPVDANPQAPDTAPSKKIATQEKAPEQKAAKQSNDMVNPDSIGYTIQVISVNTAKAADETLAALTRQGFAAYTVRSKVAGETWYRLRIGYFETRAAAGETMAKLRVNQYDPILIKL